MAKIDGGHHQYTSRQPGSNYYPTTSLGYQYQPLVFHNVNFMFLSYGLTLWYLSEKGANIFPYGGN